MSFRALVEMAFHSCCHRVCILNFMMCVTSQSCVTEATGQQWVSAALAASSASSLPGIWLWDGTQRKETVVVGGRVDRVSIIQRAKGGGFVDCKACKALRLSLMIKA